jgi:hypothetical protein
MTRLLAAAALALGLVLGSCTTTQPTSTTTAATTTRANASNATLPVALGEFTLGEMARGQRAYTLPWGMWVDEQRRCWLNPDYPAEAAPDGTVEMPVYRLADGTFEVDVRGLDEQWTPEDDPGYFGQDGPWLRVSRVLS